jgi:hypothetical protein
MLLAALLLAGCSDDAPVPIPSCGGSGVAAASEHFYGSRHWAKVSSYYYVYTLEVACNDGTSYSLHRSPEFSAPASDGLDTNTPLHKWIRLK